MQTHLAVEPYTWPDAGALPPGLQEFDVLAGIAALFRERVVLRGSVAIGFHS